jgi:hypothetical protein
MLNKSRYVSNTSGFPGVHWHGGKWQARISAYGKRVSLGHFSEIEDAAAAYRKAKSELHSIKGIS